MFSFIAASNLSETEIIKELNKKASYQIKFSDFKTAVYENKVALANALLLKSPIAAINTIMSAYRNQDRLDTFKEYKRLMDNFGKDYASDPHLYSVGGYFKLFFERCLLENMTNNVLAVGIVDGDLAVRDGVIIGGGQERGVDIEIVVKGLKDIDQLVKNRNIDELLNYVKNDDFPIRNNVNLDSKMYASAILKGAALLGLSEVYRYADNVDEVFAIEKLGEALDEYFANYVGILQHIIRYRNEDEADWVLNACVVPFVELIHVLHERGKNSDIEVELERCALLTLCKSIDYGEDVQPIMFIASICDIFGIDTQGEKSIVAFEMMEDMLQRVYKIGIDDAIIELLEKIKKDIEPEKKRGAFAKMGVAPEIKKGRELFGEVRVESKEYGKGETLYVGRLKSLLTDEEMEDYNQNFRDPISQSMSFESAWRRNDFDKRSRVLRMNLWYYLHHKIPELNLSQAEVFERYAMYEQPFRTHVFRYVFDDSLGPQYKKLHRKFMSSALSWIRVTSKITGVFDLDPAPLLEGYIKAAILQGSYDEVVRSCKSFDNIFEISQKGCDDLVYCCMRYESSAPMAYFITKVAKSMGISLDRKNSEFEKMVYRYAGYAEGENRGLIVSEQTIATMRGELWLKAFSNVSWIWFDKRDSVNLSSLGLAGEADFSQDGYMNVLRQCVKEETVLPMIQYVLKLIDREKKGAVVDTMGMLDYVLGIAGVMGMSSYDKIVDDIKGGQLWIIEDL